MDGADACPRWAARKAKTLKFKLGRWVDSPY